ncbi:MAG: hypothetical protein KIG53_04840 [Oscillospiraceae bacterium]|nr:hypothetical protein [Oscillospiraceae bacterium]
MKRSICCILCLILMVCAFSSCRYNGGITDVTTAEKTVYINGEEVNTVEAGLGAFKGKMGDYIEFKFNEPQTFNTVFITEKTTTIRQFNIFILDETGNYKLVYTGKNVFNEDITIDTVTTTAVKVTIVNTQIDKDEFIIQGINMYNLEK